MLTSRATASGVRPLGRRAMAGRRANMSRLATPHTPFSLALQTVGIPSPLALGLRHVPRFYSTSTQSTTTSTSTSTPPPVTGQPLKAEQAVVKVPPPGSPAPTPPVPAEQAAETALAPPDSKVPAKEKKKPTGPWHKRAWAVVKKEAAHYWAGTKLLGQEIKISSKLQWKVLQGGSLTRRERRQLRRTTTDLLRLLPFSVFIIIPFMELLLPVALKLFPNMLPSTFEGQLAKEEKERKLLRVRLEMAKFLQETVKDTGLKADQVVRSDEFKEFFRKVRSTGENPSHDDIIRVAKLFDSEITLDNLSRAQLVSVCKYMNIHAFGTDTFLKHQIRSRIEKIRVDDMMIHAEGVDSLSTKELQQACQSRGIRFQGTSPAHLREELEQWIDLHYMNKISGVLLILSRAFNFGGKTEDVLPSLVSTLASLPESLVDETELAQYKDDVDFKQKLEVLQQQQELIEEEAVQEKEEAEARKERKEAEEAAKEAEREAKAAEKAAAEAEAAEKAIEAKATGADEPPVIPVTDGATPIPAAAPTTDAKVADAAPEAKAKAEEPVQEEPKPDAAKMTKEQLNELAEALSILTAKSSIAKERNELAALFEDNLLSEARSKENPDEADSKSVALSKRVRSMIKKIDAQLEKYDERVGSSLNLIHTNAKGQIRKKDLFGALRVIAHPPPDEIIEEIGQKLDPDGDGMVELDHVLELAQEDALGLGVLFDEATDLLDKGSDIRHSKDLKDVKEIKPKREDIVAE
ncbi:LETM1-domain-containing protein [Cutaneotrichosporon oleaginosum]|uniref:Mitochondrial proton/calcium exchanger protein n=1 Tax=Cutaneotrichosporon oleaginosum TaxID=879819 RepID=A0A0J0XTR9_9TREE|nr:LETM1-domain-containing protein [Cutaneotrichosporon oleaginosum]KLT44460.1 LETM1-domain-containing protein [Cutaneotrichosporon oleaginosum]TXT07821.1 hypothetical protein COLE_04745 [Cutaneotrichosporon oleaginosum]